MCIALLSTAHPKYRLILIDNRDEFLHRPTAPASWWAAPHSHVLAGRDLLRSVQGTWLGVTTDGRIAVLTNFRDDQALPEGTASRGAIVRSFLTDSPTTATEAFVKGMVASQAGAHVGGFSLVCGRIGEPLAVMSNRMEQEADIPWISNSSGLTVGLSNAAYGDRSWEKVTVGEQLVQKALAESISRDETEEDLIHRLLDLLSTDSLPRLEHGAGLETYLGSLKGSIFVPAIGRKLHAAPTAEEAAAATAAAAARVTEKANMVDEKKPAAPDTGSGLYGTQKQTVVLADQSGRVRYFERTLYDNEVREIPLGDGDRDFVFNIITK